MGPEQIIDIFRGALYIVILVVSSIVLPGLTLGLIISVFQAATQINEQTLSFIPRLIITMIALLVFGPWLLTQVLSYTSHLINNIPFYVQ